jgi:hypothetical protein
MYLAVRLSKFVSHGMHSICTGAMSSVGKLKILICQLQHQNKEDYSV